MKTMPRPIPFGRLGMIPMPPWRDSLLVQTAPSRLIALRVVPLDHDLNDIANLTSTPSTGYLFTGPNWSGDLTSSDLNVSVNMSANREVNATFVQDTADTVLSNYAELDDRLNSDDDGLTDGEDVSIGLDPNTDGALMTFFGGNPPPGWKHERYCLCTSKSWDL